MNLTKEFQPIRNWAEQKGIFAKGDLKTQTLKCVEEVGELAKAVIENKPNEIIDAIGDVVITLTSVAQFAGMSIEYCINEAFKVIANRQGTMSNGTFIKEA